MAYGKKAWISYNGSWQKQISFRENNPMTEVSDQENKDEEDGVAQLAILIKEAGEEARKRKKEAMERHFKMIEAAIAEGLARSKGHIHSWKKNRGLSLWQGQMALEKQQLLILYEVYFPNPGNKPGPLKENIGQKQNRWRWYHANLSSTI